MEKQHLNGEDDYIRNPKYSIKTQKIRFLALECIHLPEVHRHTQTRNSLFMADVRERAVERDSVADINVEAVFPVGLVDSVIFCQRERLPLLTITYQTHMYRSTNKEKKK